MLNKNQRLWDQAAATFDEAPDHGLRDPTVRRAWNDLLLGYLPTQPITILDIGCGTGSLSLLLAELGHSVTGLDFSPDMLAQARIKATTAGYAIPFLLQDAANPQIDSQRFDLILCRHLLWALPQPAQVLQRWANLLQPGGQFILIEGFWHTGAGLHAQQIVDALPPSMALVKVDSLSGNPQLWGKTVTDERYAVIACQQKLS